MHKSVCVVSILFFFKCRMLFKSAILYIAIATFILVIIMYAERMLP